ncbi:MAG TPA: DUF177 domain-containing protein [Acidimicrobiales bacterium]|nr:DUF177 domain-containing protein [Acidimicrobiales bacterium]
MRRTRHDHPFVVEVGALRRAPGTRRQVEIAAEIPELFVSGSRVPEQAAVRFSGVLESVHEGILVTGVVEAPWEGECRRCLEPARGEVRASVRELAVEHGDEETTYALDPEELDLEPIVHDACILELPLAPLCDEGCRGLCPTCGANRNAEPCTCQPPLDNRLAPLALLGGRGSQGGGPELGHGALRRPPGRSDSGRPRRA